MQSSNYTFVITQTSILMIDLVTYEQRIVDAMSCPRLYNKVTTLIQTDDLAAAYELMANKTDEVVDVDAIRAECMSAIIETRTRGRFTMEGWTNGDNSREWKVSYTPSTGGERMYIHGTFFERILAAFDDDGVMEVMEKFLVAAESNPYSNIAPVDLFEFLAVNSHPITTDGHFLAFKIVRNDLYDLHSGTVYHGIGTEVALDPKDVDFNRSVTCSTGLHFCSKDYLPQYGGFFGRSEPAAVLVVKISPSEVAAFPRDYNNAKGRAVKYTVVARLPERDCRAAIEAITSLHIIDDSDIANICMNAQIQSRNTVTAAKTERSVLAFANEVDTTVTNEVNKRVTAAGPVPTIAHVGWIVMSHYVTQNAAIPIQCVANAKSRAEARVIAKRYNEDFATDTLVYRVWDNR